MSAAVTRTKILIPRRREDLLSRPRLLRTLDDVLDYPFTLISAPAGYGKTSLLVDFVQQSEFPVCWFSLDKLDQDPQRFINHLICCIQIRFPGFGEISSGINKDIPNSLDNTAQLITSLVNELYDQVTEHIVIVLDDFYLVSNNDQIASFISKFGQSVDENIHLMITSRYQFDFPDLPLLLGRRKIKTLGYTDLAFSEEEIQSLYSDVYNQALSGEQSKHLINDTEGWITGLYLSRKHVKELSSGPQNVTQVTGANIFNYLAEQVFYDQPIEIREFLLQSSVFDEFSQKLCVEVLGWPKGNKWEQIIQSLIQQNLFIQQIDDQQSWFRYHNLFLDFLRNNFRKFQPEQEEELLSRLVDVYAQLREWEKAYDSAQRLGNATTLAKVIEQASPDLFHSGRIHLLSTWLSQLPRELLNQKPAFEIQIGICNTILGKPDLGLQQLNETIQQDSINTEPKLLSRAYLFRATTYRLLGNYPRALDDIRKIQQITLPNEISWKINAEYHREAGLIYSYYSNNVLSLKYLDQSLFLYDSNFDKDNSSLVHSDLGLVYMDLGDYQAAEFHFSQAEDIWNSLSNLYQLSVLYNNFGILKILTGNFSEASSYLSTGLEYAKSQANLRMEAYTLASFGDLAFALSAYSISIDYYKKSKQLAQIAQEGYLLLYLSIRYESINRFICADNINNNISRYFHITNKRRISRLGIGLWKMENGLKQTIKNKYIQGHLSFWQAKFIFKKINKPLELANVQVGQALLETRAGKSTSALKFIHSALKTINNIGSIQPLLPILSRHYDDFITILLVVNDPELINLRTELIDFHQDLPKLRKQIFPDQDFQTPPKQTLQIQGFGKTQLLINGENVSTSEWIHQKTARELFYFLLTQPQGISKDEVGLVFWPESSPSQLYGQFKNAIYRLRRAIGKERILYDASTRIYVFNSNLDYSYDVEDFLYLLDQAQQETQPISQLEIYQQAIKLYHHPYAADLDGIWIEPIRRDLYLKYENAVLILANNMFNADKQNYCLDLCQELIEIDPCQEQAYQLCMRSCASLGDSTGVHRYYQNCKKNLNEILNIDPSRETQLILESILA